MLDRIADLFADSARPVLSEIRGMLGRLERGAVLFAVMTAIALTATTAALALVAAAVVALVPSLGVAGALSLCGAIVLSVALLAAFFIWKAFMRQPRVEAAENAAKKAADAAAESLAAGSPQPPPEQPMPTDTTQQGRKHESITDPAVIAASLAAAVIIFGPRRVAGLATGALEGLKLAGTLLAGADLLNAVQSVASALSSVASPPAQAAAQTSAPSPNPADADLKPASEVAAV